MIKGILLLCMTAYLFYDTWIAALALLPALYVYLLCWKSRQCRKKEQEFREQFRVSIQTMASALNVGYSVENAVRETARDLKPLFRKDSRIRKEFERMIHQLDMNQPVEQVMNDLAAKMCIRDRSQEGRGIYFRKITCPIQGRNHQIFLKRRELRVHTIFHAAPVRRYVTRPSV